MDGSDKRQSPHGVMRNGGWGLGRNVKNGTACTVHQGWWGGMIDTEHMYCPSSLNMCTTFDSLRYSFTKNTFQLL